MHFVYTRLPASIDFMHLYYPHAHKINIGYSLPWQRIADVDFEIASRVTNKNGGKWVTFTKGQNRGNNEGCCTLTVVLKQTAPMAQRGLR